MSEQGRFANDLVLGACRSGVGSGELRAGFNQCRGISSGGAGSLPRSAAIILALQEQIQGEVNWGFRLGLATSIAPRSFSPATNASLPPAPEYGRGRKVSWSAWGGGGGAGGRDLFIVRDRQHARLFEALRLTGRIFSSIQLSMKSSLNTPPALRKVRSCRATTGLRAASRRPSGSSSAAPSAAGRRGPCPSPARIDLVGDAVEAGHQQRGEGEIGVCHRIGKRTSTRLAFGFEVNGMRQDAERLRAE